MRVEDTPMSSRKLGRELGVPHLAGKAAKRAVASLEEALLTREEWLRLAAQGSQMGLWYWHERTQGLFWDKKAREIFGVHLDGEMTLETFYGAVHPDDLPRVKHVWRSQLESGTPYELDYRARRPDGSIRWINARGRGYYSKSGRPLYMIGVVFDVTERKEVELQRLQFSGRLLKAQDQERNRLAQEIHDDFCQRFTVLAVKLQTLAGTIERTDEQALAKELLGEFTELGSEIQSLSHRLHSSQLEILGLVASLNALRTNIAKDSDIRFELDHANIPDQIPADVALAFFRITQEALRNVVKHSGASKVEICLKGDVGKISLTVFDNGRGFNAERRGTSQGIGMLSMEERARMLGGQFRVQSRPSVEGTRVDVTIEFKQPQQILGGA